MANIYKEANQPLHELLDKARSGDGATVLIPDLQRPYVWTPNQVVLLIDSLIRGWPFGTLLMWKIGQDDLDRIPHRPFWQVVDRTDGADKSTVERKNPPASYHMVLDGQQRVQSLLLAMGGDSWGFKMEDRDWAQEVQSRRLRGRQGHYRHWSKASLCFDIDAFLNGYRLGGGLLSVDFRDVLRWVITDPTDGQSKWDKPQNYEYPLEQSAKNTGRFIRLSRLWLAAVPDSNLKEAGFKAIVADLFTKECIALEMTDDVLTPMGELMTTLRDVKLSNVTYLELQPYNKYTWKKEDDYNDAIVNVFTRLNTAGRTLTREEITLAWLKVGWDPAVTADKTAGECFELLLKELQGRGLNLAIDDLVGAVSLIWTITKNGGKLLENSDLLKGAIIKPMAKELASNWSKITRAILECTDALRERSLEYGGAGQYQSLNSLATLWAWSYLAVNWEDSNGLKERPKDDFIKKCRATFNALVDRWIFGSQWANRWANATSLAKYAKEMCDCVPALALAKTPDAAHQILETHFKTLVTEIESDAVVYAETVSTQSRERVSIYRTLLWVWHRLDAKRWEMSKVPLRTGRSKNTPLDVDHTVAWALWDQRLNAELPVGLVEKEEALPIVNRLGNCSLLAKSFNISKNKMTLKSFMTEVHEIKTTKIVLADWAKELAITDALLDPNTVTVDEIVRAIEEREQIIRKEVVEFLKGTRSRADL